MKPPEEASRFGAGAARCAGFELAWARLLSFAVAAALTGEDAFFTADPEICLRGAVAAFALDVPFDENSPRRLRPPEETSRFGAGAARCAGFELAWARLLSLTVAGDFTGERTFFTVDPEICLRGAAVAVTFCVPPDENIPRRSKPPDEALRFGTGATLRAVFGRFLSFLVFVRGAVDAFTFCVVDFDFCVESWRFGTGAAVDVAKRRAFLAFACPAGRFLKLTDELCGEAFFPDLR